MTREGHARDPLVDIMRAVAMLGVVVGHWMVTAVVSAPGGVFAGLDVGSPLRWFWQLVPLSWVLQTLGLFFFAGGFAGATSLAASVRRGERTLVWFGTRVRRLVVAVAVVVVGWVAVLALLSWFGLSSDTAGVVRHLVFSPLWFLGV